MDAIEALKGRRSIRKYKEEKVDRALMSEILEIARWAPSWANFQVARWTLVDDHDTITRLATDGVNGFVYNINTLKNAKGVAVLSFVQGKSGKGFKKDAEGNRTIADEYATSKAHVWEVFDAGIAAQTFCLAAYSKGVGTCVMGVIDEKSISEIIHLPKEETVAALIVYGMADETPGAPPRKELAETCRFI